MGYMCAWVVEEDGRCTKRLVRQNPSYIVAHVSGAQVRPELYPLFHQQHFTDVALDRAI